MLLNRSSVESLSKPSKPKTYIGENGETSTNMEIAFGHNQRQFWLFGTCLAFR